MVKFTINNIPVEANKGETILEVARRYGIYIPTMCYISKTSPCASCRICSVEVEGVDGFVLSCNTPPTEGINVVTDSKNLQNERTNIMKLYDVNHPLECGVCDKSGECDLQNKTLEFGVAKQDFSAKDQFRALKHWNLIDYDPALCILCEKCVHVCNEVIGDDAIEIKMGGYKSTIKPKNAETLDCTFCGECIAVCPVGALVSSNFKYSANAWELSRVPATCAHCSAGCSLEYEVRHSGINGEKKIYRVKNDFEYATLCGAGRFGFDFEIQPKIHQKSVKNAAEAFKKADVVRFSSIITNEEALLLQKMKEELGFKLINEDARLFREFLESFSSVTGKRLYQATLEDVKKSDAIIVLGTQIATDNPGVRYAMTVAAKQNGAQISYFHPIEDALLQNVVTQFVKIEAGTEEGVTALLAKALVEGEKVPKKVMNYFSSLDEGYLEAESNVGEEEITQMQRNFKRAKTKTLIAGADLFAHKRAKEIAVLLGLIEKYSSYKVLLVPSEVNTLGVSLLCELDKPSKEGYSVGYNAKGDYTISSFDEEALFVIPSLNQQEGTLTSIDKQVLPTNAALGFEGACLNDIARYLGISSYEYTIEFTKELGSRNAAFEMRDFDTLENFLGPLGEDNRGYKLKNSNISVDYTLKEVAELPEFNGTVIYHANPVLQFNAYTARASQLPKDAPLRGSKQFAIAAKIEDGEEVVLVLKDETIQRRFKLDENLKGTVAINPTFDRAIEANRYRFEKSKIERVQS